MTKVDFFIWPLCEKRSHELAVCNLISSIYRTEGTLTVLIEDNAERKYFDRLLWTFEETSFIPHGANNSYPVELVSDSKMGNKNILVNLGSTCPMNPRRFKTIVETAGYNESTRSKARLKFKAYKDFGIGVSSHNLKDIMATKDISLR